MSRDDVRAVPVDFWIECDGSIADYRARMCAGDEEHVPHGVFQPEVVEYRGELVDVSITRVVFEALTRDRRQDHQA